MAMTRAQATARAVRLLDAVYGPPTPGVPLTRPAAVSGAGGRGAPAAPLATPGAPSPPPLTAADLASDWTPRPLPTGHRGRYLW